MPIVLTLFMKVLFSLFQHSLSKGGKFLGILQSGIMIDKIIILAFGN
jgi:hypothetical protein